MKILVFAGFSKSLIHFRKELLMSMIKQGNEVIAVGPENDYVDELREIGVRFEQVEFNRLGINPLSDFKLVLKLIKLMNFEKPDIFFGYTIKPVIYGSIAAWISGVKKRFVMVTGLGSIFIDGNTKKKYIKLIAKMLYRLGFACSTNVFFQNKDDMNEFIDMNLLKKEKCLIVNGSGVNLEYYFPSSLPMENIFLFVGSVMGDKGVREYMNASSLVKKRNPSARFWIVGPMDNRLTGVTESELNYYVEEGSIEYFGLISDVRTYLDRCRFFVLPSYREGTPRSVLEAMAKGRPIITTDAPGCRETVINGVNGFLVPVRDYKILAEKMIWMIDHPSEVAYMAEQSLEIVRTKYDVNIVNKYMLKSMGL